MNRHVDMADLLQLFAEEEQCGPIAPLAELAMRIQHRKRIQQTIVMLEKQIDQHRQRLEALPSLPDSAGIQWAQQILCYPNSRILSVDTVFPAESASLVQVLVLDFAGQVRLHHCVTTEYTLSRADMARFGICERDMQDAIPLLQLWPVLLEALHGCYLLACDLRWISMVLEQEAQHCQLEMPVIIGEDLLIRAIRFYQASGRTNLTSLCRLIGHSLSPNAGIIERARCQLALLEAMAQGITGSTGMIDGETHERR